MYTCPHSPQGLVVFALVCIVTRTPLPVGVARTTRPAPRRPWLRRPRRSGHVRPNSSKAGSLVKPNVIVLLHDSLRDVDVGSTRSGRRREPGTGVSATGRRHSSYRPACANRSVRPPACVSPSNRDQICGPNSSLRGREVRGSFGVVSAAVGPSDQLTSSEPSASGVASVSVGAAGALGVEPGRVGRALSTPAVSTETDADAGDLVRLGYHGPDRVVRFVGRHRV